MTSQLARDLPAALGTPATGSTSRTGDGPARVVVDLDLPGPTISHHLYGHFAEHLGRCIYGGFFVGEDSEIPNTRGTRDDVVAALRALHIPNLRWPGGCFASTTGRTASAPASSARAWSTPTGATSSRTTPSARTSSWTSSSCSAPRRTSAATSAPARSPR